MNTSHVDRINHAVTTRLLSLICLLSVAATAMASLSAKQSLLRLYDEEVSQAETYFSKRQHQIDSIADLPHDGHRWIEMGDLYRPYQCDSALACYQHALTADEPTHTLAQIRLVYLLASIGYYSESFSQAKEIHHVPAQHRVDYYRSMNHLYGEAAVYSKVHQFRETGFQMARTYSDSLYDALCTSPTPSIERYKIDLIHARNRQDYQQAFLVADSAINLVPEYSHDYAILAYEKAITYREIGDSDNFCLWLVRSAISDVRCGVTDNGSSWMLAEMMYDEGQLTRAHQYIEYSLANAARFNARLRYVQINPLGLLINRTYQAQQNQLSNRLQIAVVALLAVLALLALLVVYTLRQNRRLHALYDKQGLMNAELNTLNAQLTSLNRDLSSLNSNLQEASLVKEQYICRYLEVYSEYVRRLTQMARKAGVKDPDAFLSKEMSEFYRSFDNTFLSIYRTFVSEFNALLRPDQQIVPKQGELLTTELRIFALIRLGIDSSAKIAELLCYSPNTIYNYRARVKNGALGDRDTFESRVRNLCTLRLE